MKSNPLLFKPDPSVFFQFQASSDKYDYETYGDRVAVTNSRTARVLSPAETKRFWAGLDSTERDAPSDEVHRSKTQAHLASFASDELVIQVDAQKYKKSAVSYVATVRGTDTNPKIGFTSSIENALRVDKKRADEVNRQLATFALKGELINPEE